VQVSKEASYKISTEPQWSRCGKFFIARWNKFVLVHEFDGNNVTQTLKLEHSDDIWDMRFSPCGQRLAVASGKEKVYLWDWQSKALKGVLKGCCKANWGLAHI